GRLGLLEVVLEALRQRLAGRPAAELLDAELGMGALQRRGGDERVVDRVLGLVGVALQLEVDDAGAAVLRQLDLLDLLRVLRRLDPRADVLDDGLERGRLVAAVAGLDQDDLARRVLRERALDRLVGLLRRAAAGVAVLDLL